MMEDEPEFKKAVGELHEQIVKAIAPHVLIVDDCADDVVILRHALIEACPHVHVQSSGEPGEALACVRAFSFDLVILDLRLGGGMSGVSVFTSIRQTSTVPVIGLTGLDDRATLVRDAFEAGLKVIFKKPLDQESINLLFGTPGVIRPQEIHHDAANH